jgi:hypothetical protein
MVTALYKSINSARRPYRGSIAKVSYSLTQFKFKFASLKIGNACSVSVSAKKSVEVKVL